MHIYQQNVLCKNMMHLFENKRLALLQKYVTEKCCGKKRVRCILSSFGFWLK